MNSKEERQRLTRRDFVKMGAGMLGAVVSAGMVRRSILEPDKAEAAVGWSALSPSVDQAVKAQGADPVSLHFVASDGWIHLPEEAPVPPYHPDGMGPRDELNCYVFGFRDVTPFSTETDKVYGQKMKVQQPAPLFWFEQEKDYTIKLTNVGLQIRPDLIDAHTLHFHGFRNAIPIFDGEPHSSVGVPIARALTYFYRAHYPGTYMYHCHFEETEHVHMGMVGPCYVTPIQNEGGAGIPTARLKGGAPDAPMGYVYNDGVPPGDPRSTAYDREFVMFLSEVWAKAHWCDSHIQLPEWSNYAPEFYLLNGRVYPDTLLPDGQGIDPATGDLIAPAGHSELQYQPVSSLVKVNAGDRVLLRIINLGYEQQTVRLDAAKMKVVGKDATYLLGRDDTDLTYLTQTVAIGASESVDAIFVAPPYRASHELVDGEGQSYNRYLFYNRDYRRLNNGGHPGWGGQMTEVHVYPENTLPAQDTPPGHYE
jgi:FtsP/CotA-like multicopper oxidase with cupredoxin domain